MSRINGRDRMYRAKSASVWRFRLRTLFIIVTVAAVVMGLVTADDLPATVVLVLCWLWFLLPVWLPFLLMRFQDRTR